MSLDTILNKAHESLLSAKGFDTFRLLEIPLRDLYLDAISSGTKQHLINTAREHPIFKIAQEDPFTKRCNDKPRGYAGDAVMLDYVYSRLAPEETSAIGKNWFNYTTVGGMALSVRYRRDFLHSLIDDTVSNTSNYRLLSVASGHCRELDSSLVLSNSFSGHFVALDQDEESCKFVQNTYVQPKNDRVQVLNESLRYILNGRLAKKFPQFHLIYSAGLFDYLGDKVAIALTKALIDSLSPGGKLVIANFLPESQSRGYAEIFMDWHLIYRSSIELTRIFGSGSKHVTTQVDPHGNVVYATYSHPQ